MGAETPGCDAGPGRSTIALKMFPTRPQICRREAGDQANRSLALGQVQLAPHQSNRDQNQAGEERREMCGQPGTGMRQDGSGNREPDTDKEKK
jgi:hypothetical protein